MKNNVFGSSDKENILYLYQSQFLSCFNQEKDRDKKEKKKTLNQNQTIKKWNLYFLAHL